MRAQCVRDDCERPKYTRETGYCLFHQRRFLRGTPLDSPFKSHGEIFERHFQKTDGCWEWEGYIDPSTGYGRSKQAWAHRVSYERYVGPIPTGQQIDHLCRNRACVNPDHLESVPPRINTLRGFSPGAISVRTNRCKRGHEWTPDNIYWRPDGEGRQCRACIRMRTARKTQMRSAA